MSGVKRSTYQKAIEENKRLKKDIETLVMRDDLNDTKKVYMRWHKYFSDSREFNDMMKEIANSFFNKD